MKLNVSLFNAALLASATAVHGQPFQVAPEWIHNPDEYAISDGILGTSGAGGTCTCPSGITYVVADNYDGCQSLQCVGGVSELKCNDPVTGADNGYQYAAEMGKRGWGVVCGTYTFKRVDERMSWNAHNEQAKAVGCSLASILNEDEQAKVEDLFLDGIDERIWIGASRTGPGVSDWEWSDGSAFGYSNWQEGEPNNPGEDGALMDTRPLGERYWNDVPKKFEYSAVYKCPLDPTPPPKMPTTSPTAIDKTDYDFIEKVPRMSQADIVKVMNWIKAEVTMVKNEFCWRRSYGRGVGKPLHTCERQGKVKIGALCYSHCPAGMKRFGFDCHSVCPSGSQDQGLFCRWNEYGRGAGFPWKFGDPLNDSGMYKRCHKKHGRGNCEKHGLIVYPKCRSGYSPFGCCICRPALPNCAAHNLGGRFDLSCAKKIQIGDPTPMDCAEDEDEDAGLCYKKCRGGYNGVGPVCWGYCDDSQVDCGLGCAKSAGACFDGTFDQVLAPLILAANVASLGLAAPATATATMTIKVAGKVVAGTTRVGKAFVWAVKQLQTTGKIRKVDGKDAFVLNGLKENGFKVLTEIMDPMSMDFNEETKATIYAITDIIEGNTGTNEAKESYQAMRDYKEAFADDFAGQTSTDISDELERNFHPLTARFLKETWAEYSLTELAEAEGWETADTILTTASAVDITGVMGVVDAYAKPECNAIVPFPSTAANLL